MLTEKKLAVLIDADNASADIIAPLLAEIAKYGIASVKRIYGDWSSGLSKWKEALLPHAIIPVQQFAYTKGKNATDMALVIDAMDLLYSKTFDGFCIVSSDSDFTRLASRIRENGVTVYGFGEKKTPESFRKACDTFIYTENLLAAARAANAEETVAQTTTELKHTEQPANAEEIIYRAIKETADDNGWVQLGSLRSYIGKTNPDFDHRSYGFGKFSDLVRTLPKIDIKTIGNTTIYIRRQSYRRFIRLVQEIIESQADNGTGTELNNVCSRIRQLDPDFNPKTLGQKTVSQAVRNILPTWVEIYSHEGKEYIRNVKTMM